MSIESILKMTEKETQYDEKAKSLVANKMILAYILKNTVDEFRDMDPKIIKSYIEGDPYISHISVEPGMTNFNFDNRIVGNNTENYELHEGMIRFDIVFYVRMRDGISQIIINVEIQKDEPTTYAIGNRAVFYVSRLISSQKEREFVHSDYDDIKPVYSIWICMNMKDDCMNHIHFTNERLLGNEEWAGNFDLLNIIFIGLSKEEKQSGEAYELHRLLRTMFSMQMSADEKISILKNDYNILVDDKFRREVTDMCNLSQGIKEEGREEGRQEGEQKERAKIVNNMYQSGISIEKIASIVQQTEDAVKKMLHK